MTFYRQCTLKKGAAVEVAWIPEALATTGKYLRVRDDDGWQVGRSFFCASKRRVPSRPRSETMWDTAVGLTFESSLTRCRRLGCMKLSLPRWVAGITRLIDENEHTGADSGGRRALPLLFTGFIIGQAVVWLLTPRKLSQ